jgi:hypothetical protein
MVYERLPIVGITIFVTIKKFNTNQVEIPCRFVSIVIQFFVKNCTMIIYLPN